MKKIIFTLALILMTLGVNQSKANNYIWMHGLYDDNNCWNIYNNALTPGIGTCIYYSCKQGIPSAATKTWNNSDPSTSASPYFNINGKRDMILVGHSLGGLVAREMQYQYANQKDVYGNPKVKGIITMGTPNEGAQIENELANKGVKGLASKVTLKFEVSTGLSIASLISIFPYSLVSGVTTGYKFVSFIETFKSAALDKAMGSFANGTQTCEKQMRVGSTYMNDTLANRKVTVPILCFAAEEDRWQLARLAYAAQGHYTLQTNSNINSTGTYDQTGYDYMQSGVNVSNIIGEVHTGIAAACVGIGFACPYYWYVGGLNGVAAASWFGNASYLNNGLDFDHAVLVGASHVDRIDTWHKVWFVKWVTTQYITVPEPHDGVVPTKSQYLATSKGTNVIIPAQTIKGVNHMEEFNHPNTKAELNKAIVLGGYKPDTFQK